MRLLVAVIVDLVQFVRSAFFVAVPRSVVQVSASYDDVNKEEPVQRPPLALGAPAYITHEKQVVWCQPRAAFDEKAGVLTFGDQVICRQYEGDWYQVVTSHYEGWVPRTSLTNRREEVFPVCIPDCDYPSNHPSVRAIRHHIQDAFSCGAAALPLTSAEYVVYCLIEKGHTIPWRQHQQRLEGQWHRLLRGVPGVSITISPATGVVIEYCHDVEHGMLDRVGYVTSVAPDETIEIATVSHGVMRVLRMKRVEWVERKSLFITLH